ncbi:MAG: hypothetical protein AAGC85_02175, partial [Bacteroidota bacterium]
FHIALPSYLSLSPGLASCKPKIEYFLISSYFESLMNKSFVLLSLFCITFSLSYTQSDEINISAAFSSSIDLRIASGANINWTFATLKDYTEGKCGFPVFQVASSVNFNVYFSMTPFTSPDGDEIDLKNITYWWGVAKEKSAEVGDRIVFGDAHYGTGTAIHAGVFHGGLNYGTTSEMHLIGPGPGGNAGGYEENTFTISICINHGSHRATVGMPNLLDQNIAPGTYTATIKLEASAAAL